MSTENIVLCLDKNDGPGSSAGMATELRARRCGDRIPVGRDFPPVQTCPGAHPTSCTMGTGPFPGVKYGRGVLLTTHPFLVPRSWKSRAIFLHILWATTRPVTGTLYLTLDTNGHEYDSSLAFNTQSLFLITMLL